MTREQAKELLPIMQAFAEGKIIQVLDEGEWFDLREPDFKKSTNRYRIKPEPKYRPFKSQEECWDEMHKHHEFGWARDKKERVLLLITAISDKFVYFDGGATKIDKAYDIYEFTDGTPFGIKEE